jgi:hypothetical protein
MDHITRAKEIKIYTKLGSQDVKRVSGVDAVDGRNMHIRENRLTNCELYLTRAM